MNLSADLALLRQAIETNKKRPFGHRLKEKFHQFQFNFYKEREMSDFRKLLLAFAAITLFAGFASAQVAPPITCSTTAQPLTVRAEGLTSRPETWCCHVRAVRFLRLVHPCRR
jgi:hypothetical protein